MIRLRMIVAITTMTVATLLTAQEKTQPLKIAVFNSKRLVLEHWKYPQIMASLKKEKDRLDGIFRKKAASVQALSKRRDELVAAANSVVLSPEAKRAKQSELKTVQREGAVALNELRGMEKKFYQDMLRKEKAERSVLTKDILDDIRDYGKRHKYTMIIDKAQGVAFSDSSIDITEELLKLVNAGHEVAAPTVEPEKRETKPETKDATPKPKANK